MAAPYSDDLRSRIVAAVEAGASCRSAAAQFSVSVSCAIKLLRRWRETGSVSAGQMGGWKEYALSAHEGRVRALVAGRADLTLEELRAALARDGIVVGRTSIWRFLDELGLTLKKSRSMPPSRTARTSPQRARAGGPSNPA